MYREKKVSKLALICCSFLLALSSMLAFNPSWLSNVYGTTLCASSTAPTIDSTYFDYTNTGLVSTFDWSYNNRFFNGTSTIFSKYVKISSDFVVFSNTTLTGRYYGPKTPNNSMTFTSIFDYSYYDFSCTLKSQAGGYTGVDMFTFSSLDSAKQSILSNYDWVGYVNISDTYYILCSDSLYSKYLAYNQGITAGAGTYEDGYNAGYSAGQTAGEQTGYQNGYNAGYSEGEGVGYNTGYTDGHTAGYTDGQNTVINHPSDYDLYTQEQYQNNYNTGYSNGQNTVINNPEEFDLYTQDQFDGNYTAGYNTGLDVGQQAGYSEGYGVGYDEGESAGYVDGYSDGISKDISFKNLIFAVVDVPVETVRSLFNFDLLGFNLYNFFIAILTACVLVILIKLVMKGK